MLQRHTPGAINGQNDIQGMIMPTADKAERFINACLLKAGRSGRKGTGVSMGMPE